MESGMRTKRRRASTGRRTFLKASAAGSLGLAFSAADASGQAPLPRDLRLGQLRMIDLSVALEHGAPGERFPVKIKGGSAGWCRAVALVP